MKEDGIGIPAVATVVTALVLITLPAVVLLAATPCTMATAICDMPSAPDGGSSELARVTCCQVPAAFGLLEPATVTNDPTRRIDVSTMSPATALSVLDSSGAPSTSPDRSATTPSTLLPASSPLPPQPPLLL